MLKKVCATFAHTKHTGIMKFTKEQLTEALKAKMTATGKKLSVSERTIKAQAERIYTRLEKAGNEEELEAVVTEYIADFEEMDANIRNDNSAFIKGWKQEHPDKQSTPPDPDGKGSGQGGQGTLDEAMRKMMERLEQLEAKNAAHEAEAAKTAKTASIKQGLLEKGVKDTKWVDNYTRKISVTPDTDVETEVQDALNLYNLSAAQAGGSANVGNAGGGKSGGKVDFSDIVAIKQRRMGITPTNK